MTSKRQRAQRNAARAASNEVFKKRRLEARSVPTIRSQSKIDDDKLSTIDTTDTEEEEETWFWNESANETNSDTEEDGDDVDGLDLDLEESRTERAVSPGACKTQIKWKKEGEDKLRGTYGKGSKGPRCDTKNLLENYKKKGRNHTIFRRYGNEVKI